MNIKWKTLAADLLDEAADEFSNQGCNDWEWPEDWSIGARNTFLAALYHWDKCPEKHRSYETKVNRYAPIGDSLVMSFLAAQLRKDR